MPMMPSVRHAPSAGDAMTARLNFIEAPLDIILADYSEKTGRTLLRAPNLPTPSFTLRSQGELTIDEYLKAIESLLAMHGIGLVDFGERFVRVVPIKSVRRETLEIIDTPPERLVVERSGSMISQLIQLKHIDIPEATQAIEPIRNEHGQINSFERTNSLLVTDMPENINRMLQILRMLDQPIEAREEPNVIQIRFASAADIKRRLEEIIAESQREQQASTVPRQRQTGAPGVQPTAPAGVIRPQRPATREAAAPEPSADLIEAAERGIIRGRVQIIADERTNILIIITRPENMSFFERIIGVLDVETSPDVMVKVFRLDFATAEDIASMLNELIGATQQEERRASTALASGEERSESRRLAEVEAALRQQRQDTDRKSSVGELSKENIKILSDKRTNSLIIMASKSDLEALQDIIRDMDMMLSQVLIEAVIIEVNLDNTVETGVSWVQKSLTSYRDGSTGQRRPVFSFAGGGGGGAVPLDASRLNDPSQLATPGLGYFFSMFDVNVNMILKASASDSRSRVVSTPALLTTDNTEATLTSTERIYVFEGTTFVGTATDSRTARYRQEDVGLSLTVRPQINANHVVMMQIKQEISEPGDIIGLDTENLTGQRISVNRTLEASIAVQSGQTIVLGGQVRESSSRNRSKIPLLGDIPILGRLFSSDRRGSGRTETIVFITPYVLDTPDQVSAETERRRDSLNIEGMWRQGWSGSSLADPATDNMGSFDRRPAAVQPRVPPNNQDRPESRPVSRLQPWTSSSGKTARSGQRDAEGAVIMEEAPESDPVAPTSNEKHNDERPQSDVDRFIQEQQRRWQEAVRNAN